MLNLFKPIIGPIIDKLTNLIPDPNARKKAKEEFEKDLLQSIAQANLAQTKINEIEAKHKSIFVAGWRPFIGWVCGFGMLWAFIIQPVAVWIIRAKGIDIELPLIDTSGLYQIVLAMLGMTGLRTFEKLKGVARNNSPRWIKKTK